VCSKGYIMCACARAPVSASDKRVRRKMPKQHLMCTAGYCSTTPHRTHHVQARLPALVLFVYVCARANDELQQIHEAVLRSDVEGGVAIARILRHTNAMCVLDVSQRLSLVQVPKR
jgi:hypothetical protein